MKSPLVFLLAFSLLWKLSCGVRCYRCLAEADGPAVDTSCQFFDGSARFIADCPDSTICLKKVVALDMLNDVNVAGITKRYCAPQILPGDHIKVNTSWMPIKRIYEERYSGKCEDVTQEGRSTKTILCSCWGDLCNHSVRLDGSFLALLGGIVFILLNTNYGSF